METIETVSLKPQEIIGSGFKEEKNILVPENLASEPDWNTLIDKKNGVVVTDDKKEFVLLAELQRLAEKKGIRRQETDIKTVDFNKKAAACTVKVEFKNGQIFSGSADCFPENSSGDFSQFPTAMAESRALARALRFGLRITMCAFEEVAPGTLRTGIVNKNGPISDGQKQVINELCKRNKFKINDLLTLGSRKVTKLEDLTSEEATNFIASLNNGSAEKLLKKGN